MKRTTWTLIMAGLMTGGLGLHLIVTQPLHRQIQSLSSEVDQLQSGMRRVADYRDDVAGTNDLLSGLQTQSQRISGARAALEDVRRLEREVHGQAQAAEEALVALTDIARLQNEVISQSQRINAMQGTLDQLADYQQRADDLAEQARGELVDLEVAEESLRQLGNFQQRVALESSGIDVAENRFARLIDLKKSMSRIDPATIDEAELRIAGLNGITQVLIESGEQVDQAHAAAADLIALQDDLVSRATRTDVALEHAQHLLTLEDTLANDAGRDIDLAQHNLARLLQMEEKLASQDQRLATAIESLELMQDLQTEFFERTRELESIRRGLTELIMMESMVARIVRTLQPLLELTDLNRMDSNRLRSVARGMIEEQGQKIASREEGQPSVSHRVEADEPDIAIVEEALVPLPPAN